jgi:large subunit ribosomal protein L18
MNHNIRTVPHRRKREGKTNYSKRISLLASARPRLVIRKTLTQFITQVITYHPKGDKVIIGVDGTMLRKKGWKGSVKNIPAAYATGYLLGKKAGQADIKEAIPDIGLHTSLPGAKIYAVVKGAIDAGMNVHCSEEMFPSEDRMQGKHIKNFTDSIEKIKESA